MTVSSLGVGSGLDLQTLLENMVSVQRDTKVDAYEDRISDYESQVSAYGAIKSALETFQDSVETLNDEELFTGRTATTTQPDSGDIVSVTADEDASNGAYNISVSQLAQGSRSVSADGLFSSSDDVVSSTGGDLTFTAGDETFTVTVEAGTTLAELREQINDADENFGVSANLVDDGNGNVFLTLSSDVTGDGNDLVVTNTDESLDSVSSVATGTGSAGLSIASGEGAQDAIINVDGITINSDTNSFEDAVSGLTIKALAVSEEDSDGELETATSVIDYDTDSVQETLESFVSSYNSLMSTFDSYTDTDAILNGSSLVRGLESQLNADLMTTFLDAGDLTSIFDIGIEMDDDGTLSLDSTAFSEAMEDSYDDVVTLFTGDDGLANIMDEYLDSYTGSSGLMKDLSDAAQEAADDTEEDLENFEYRMDQYEEQLTEKFSNLDVLLASLNNSGTALLESLSSLSS
ncbi:flagellar filament capping protein FliD [Marinomonas mediterranea]|jgi:Flagellar capping protein|uniref:Flagellar hook-associated protein 2 n=1 Tax=Marinomonas mediterranea (strain ATCC 700492 / JCM 21426 / NBRC 103028 / MMB-1) TaxID=717774 RepID=F2K0H4_MARM1|nr:flagellar filament capping protein FliD [Marinomonas mediterranea]ADZ90958.1 flagellar hook-associated 2 domain-containing protein [Marinomonas mediterranea MMB-1]WCN17101.1 flagellar filament capping protein FliD [Marinomonas mediterranea MMB-1]